MTPQHTQRLEALLSESSLLEELTANRPGLGGLSIDEIVSNAKKAEGWEACVQFLKNMITMDDAPQKGVFVDTNKGFK